MAGMRGLSIASWVAIIVILTTSVVAAVVLWVFLPGWVVDPNDYVNTVTGGLDPAAASNARISSRQPAGVLSGAIVAVAAAATGLIVSNHNARLTRETNELAYRRDVETRRQNDETKIHNERLLKQEQERAADDRFTTAISQLGDSAASVRLGGLHSLHRLGEQRIDRRLTVLDVLSAYLRQPFHHPDHDRQQVDQQGNLTEGPNLHAWWPATDVERDTRDAEAEVRRTALRLLTDLLPSSSSGTAAPDLNLQGAALIGDWLIQGKALGNLDLSSAYIGGDLRLEDGTSVAGALVLRDGASVSGYLILGEGVAVSKYLTLRKGARIGADLVLRQGAHIGGDLVLREGASVGGYLTLGQGASVGGYLTLGEGASVGGYLTLEEGASVGGYLTLEKGSSVAGDLLLRGRASVGGNLALIDGASVGGTLRLMEGVSVAGLRLRYPFELSGARGPIDFPDAIGNDALLKVDESAL
ncbi:carbonic anhydrase/acetyltransferase-like protein (isoleucine patch superfamily) [Kineococcus radiotolerans]|uniref:Carbonic anhydrase/acetyltransferase-like protein (Isoleucine patch superfamily) n=1 Tax=Kineococcus radiotolerans TaxID=131568 RepID=A0A7W4TRD0_KINRA|nr:hypothetical protein [Kineococcus radiotolerans]MBB2903101.1 carbonic anhydrase/acetyltransferase-like protein (isoleucine patch superfamily) [Kineococcus radiotolerans]